MAREKKPVHKVQMTEGKRNIIRQLLEEYDIETAGDIQEVLKDLLGDTIKEMIEAEMNDHLGYQKSERSDNYDYRNGYKKNGSTAAMAAWISRSLRTVTPPLNHRWSKRDRRTSPTLTRKLFPCTQKE